MIKELIAASQKEEILEQMLDSLNEQELEILFDKLLETMQNKGIIESIEFDFEDDEDDD